MEDDLLANGRQALQGINMLRVHRRDLMQMQDFQEEPLEHVSLNKAAFGNFDDDLIDSSCDYSSEEDEPRPRRCLLCITKPSKGAIHMNHCHEMFQNEVMTMNNPVDKAHQLHLYYRDFVYLPNKERGVPVQKMSTKNVLKHKEQQEEDIVTKLRKVSRVCEDHLFVRHPGTRDLKPDPSYVNLWEKAMKMQVQLQPRITNNGFGRGHPPQLDFSNPGPSQTHDT